MEMETQESCPRCGARMKERKEPLRIRGTYIGSYDSMSCPICKYYYFTEKEYDLALDNARSLRVVGPPLLDIGSIVTSEKLNIDPFYRIDRPSNSEIKSPPSLKIKTGHLVELEPITAPHDILVLQALSIGK